MKPGGEQSRQRSKKKAASKKHVRAEFRFGPGVSVIIEGDESTIKADLDFYRRLVERVALTADAEVTPAAPTPRERPAVADPTPTPSRGGRRPIPQQVKVDREALRAFYRKKRPRKGHWSEIVCFVYFLRDHHGLDKVGSADVLACFEGLRLKRPRKLLPRVNAIKTRTGYIRTVAPGVFAITKEGEEFVESGARLPRKKPAAPPADASGPKSPASSGRAPAASAEGGDEDRPDVKRGGRRGSRPERKIRSSV